MKNIIVSIIFINIAILVIAGTNYLQAKDINDLEYRIEQLESFNR